MKILMLVNWKVEFCEAAPANKQPPDYYTDGNSYWFFKYFKEPVHVDVIDISSFPLLEKIESAVTQGLNSPYPDPEVFKKNFGVC